MLKESNIANLNLISSIKLIIILSLSMGYVFISMQEKNLKLDLKKLKEDYIYSQKVTLKSRVSEILEYIQYKKEKIKNKLEEEELKKEIKDRVSKINFLKDGYFFIFNTKKSIIYYPFKKVGNNVSELNTTHGKKVIQKIIQTSKLKNGGYIDYRWKKIDTKEIVPKVSFALYLKDWDWVIGATIYINKINDVVIKKEGLAKERINNEIETFISIMFFFIILSIIVSLIFSKAIHKIFNDYKLKVDKKEEELKKLNESLEIKIKDKTRELKKLNESLEIRVKEELEKSRQKDKVMFQQARLAQMGEMIGNIAHQWRQPLNELGLILSSFEIATFQNRLNDDFIKDRMQKGENVIQKMSHMIDDFRNFFKPNRNKKFFKIKSTIESSLDLIKSSFKYHSIKIVENIDSDIKVFGFSNEFEQVILNILSNAKDILIYKSKKVIFIKTKITLNKVILEIYDSGDGIQEDIIDKIFNPYFTTKEQGKGTGIGLYMSKSIIIDNMNGTIYAENREFSLENKHYFGACFIVELPLAI